MEYVADSDVGIVTWGLDVGSVTQLAVDTVTAPDVGSVTQLD